MKIISGDSFVIFLFHLGLITRYFFSHLFAFCRDFAPFAHFSILTRRLFLYLLHLWEKGTSSQMLSQPCIYPHPFWPILNSIFLDSSGRCLYSSVAFAIIFSIESFILLNFIFLTEYVFIAVLGLSRVIFCILESRSISLSSSNIFLTRSCSCP